MNHTVFYIKLSINSLPNYSRSHNFGFRAYLSAIQA